MNLCVHFVLSWLLLDLRFEPLVDAICELERRFQLLPKGVINFFMLASNLFGDSLPKTIDSWVDFLVDSDLRYCTQSVTRVFGYMESWTLMLNQQLLHLTFDAFHQGRIFVQLFSQIDTLLLALKNLRQ